MNRFHILVTRPDPAGRELCRRIEAQGDMAIHFPTIAFVPLVDSPAFAQAIASLGEQEALIFVSPQAVYHSIAAIRRAWPIFPAQVQFAAVGAGTARALYEAGYVAVYPPAQENSQGVLNLAAFQQVRHKKIAIIRGQGGREMLEKVLDKRGAQVLSIIAYKRALPSGIHQVSKEIDVIIATSGEAVQNLQQMVTPSNWLYLSSLPLIVVSERIKTLAHDLGFRTIWVAESASHEAILAMLVQKKDVLWQTK